MMTPALGLFYAGLVRAKSTLNTFMMSIDALGVASVTWALIGYSLAFSSGNGVIGGFDHVLLRGVTFAPRSGTAIPQLLFMAFEATFCIITAALVSSAVVERMGFGPFLIFVALWSVPRLSRTRTLGVGRRLAPAARNPRLRGWRTRRDGFRVFGFRGGDRSRCTQGLGSSGTSPAQCRVRASRCGTVVVRLVRLQRR